MKNLSKYLVTLACLSATAMSAAAFAQARDSVDTVVVPGSRDGCSLQLLDVVPLEVNNDQLTLPADVNGKTWSFQFDTAALTEQMTEAAAQRLGLHPESPASGPRIAGNFNEAVGKALTGGFQMPMQEHAIAGSALIPAGEIYDSSGRDYTSLATVADFTMQTMEDKDIDFHISPLPPPNVDGVLSLALFQRFDIDLNFAARRFNLFSKDHCDGKILYWRAPGVAALPFITRANRIVTRVLLEGKELTAIIDTGSPVTVLRFDAAARLFGISPGDQGITLVGEHHANDLQDLYAHDFKTLSFGTVAIGNPHVLLTRKTILVRGDNPNARTGSLIANDASESQPDMIIGVDMLKLTHLYIATRERVLYVTQGPELARGDAGAQPVIPVTPFRP